MELVDLDDDDTLHKFKTILKWMPYNLKEVKALSMHSEGFEFVYNVAIEKRMEDIEVFDSLLGRHLGTLWDKERAKNFLSDWGGGRKESDAMMIPLSMIFHPDGVKKALRGFINLNDDIKEKADDKPVS